MKHLLLAVLLIATSFALARVPQTTHATKLELLSSVSTDGSDEAAAEIAADDASTQRLYVTNANAAGRLIDRRDPH